MTQASGGSAAVDEALRKFREMMASDGYLLTWSKTDGDGVVVRIEAGEGACADCLVPQPVMEAIMSEALASTPYRLDHVVLPASEK
ncbi:hypothetical protein [Phytoactinopolyspora mesophila]|uniref:NifU family protein n=1 Tax=Phytoactinopolyspora mesophila TaxID=2650750 RepID=A0A7K3M0U1_9ACTN|nr:hypothetical protein [Phytoactinopolyspora mesophila]NDL56512.1 hypothetical protein [Phytoactinopolyspora mesophila]